MRLLLLLLFVFNSSLINSQVNLDWAVSLNGNAPVGEGFQGVCDKQGNSYVCGNFLGSTDFDPGIQEYVLNSALSIYNFQSSLDAFVLKLDSSGNLQWVFPISAGENEYAYDIIFDADSNLVVCGEFRGELAYEIQGAQSSLFSLNPSGFISKISTSGILLDMRMVESTSDPDIIKTLAIDEAGVLWCGMYSGPEILKMDSDFNLLNEFFVTNVQTPGIIARISDISILNGGDAIIVAQVIFTNASLGYEFLVQRITNDGTEVWTNNYGLPDVGSSGSGFTRCATNNFNEILIGGQFRGSVDFGFGTVTSIPNTSIAGNAYVLKLNGNGQPIWFKQFSNGYSSIYDIDTDSNGDIYFSGDFQGNISFESPGFVVSSGIMSWNGAYGESIVSAKMNLNGDFLWIAPVYGTESGSLALGQWLGPDNSIYSTGYYSGISDFDPVSNVEFNLNPYCEMALNSCTDPFVRKLGQCEIGGAISMSLEGTCNDFSATLSAPSSEGYLWNTGDTTQSIAVSAFGIYSVSLLNQSGCAEVVLPLIISYDSFIEITETCNSVDDNCNGNTDEGFDTDADSFTNCSGDCDDSNPLVYPGAAEVLDLLDNNCDGQIDEGLSPDADGDGFTVADGDCDDNNASVNPNATELCNGIDDNCNTQVDEGFDLDADTFTSCNGDCDDTNALIYPGAPEVLDSLDNNCDGQIDEGFNPDPDADGDGFSLSEGDCNDANPNINPGATELCNGIDDNCNSTIDEGFDLDGDGETSCEGDCNDNDSLVNTSAIELCNSIDDNCDSFINEGLACDEVTMQIPNGISPNGDGFNDAWYLPWLNGMTDYSIVISNRWGQVIFQTNDYSSPWDGTYLGNPLPAADYFYVIKLSDNTTYEGVISIKY